MKTKKVKPGPSSVLKPIRHHSETDDPGNLIHGWKMPDGKIVVAYHPPADCLWLPDAESALMMRGEPNPYQGTIGPMDIARLAGELAGREGGDAEKYLGKATRLVAKALSCWARMKNHWGNDAAFWCPPGDPITIEEARAELFKLGVKVRRTDKGQTIWEPPGAQTLRDLCRESGIPPGQLRGRHLEQLRAAWMARKSARKNRAPS